MFYSILEPTGIGSSRCRYRSLSGTSTCTRAFYPDIKRISSRVRVRIDFSEVDFLILGVQVCAHRARRMRASKRWPR